MDVSSLLATHMHTYLLTCPMLFLISLLSGWVAVTGDKKAIGKSGV